MLLNFSGQKIAGKLDRSHFGCSVAASLARSAKLHRALPKQGVPTSRQEERSRCYYALLFLCRIFNQPGLAVTDAEIKEASMLGNSSASPLSVLKPRCQQHLSSDPGMLAVGVNSFVLHVDRILSSLVRHVKNCRSRQQLAFPWAAKSEYTAAMCALIDLSHKVPLAQRYESVDFPKATKNILFVSKGYWYPWILGRLVYHACFCILNHPIVLSVQLRGVGDIPSEFLHRVSRDIDDHTRWIAHYLELIKSREFWLSDVLMAYCVAVAATVELHRGLSRDARRCDLSKSRFEECMRFLNGMSQQWEYAKRLVCFTPFPFLLPSTTPPPFPPLYFTPPSEEVPCDFILLTYPNDRPKRCASWQRTCPPGRPQDPCR